MICSEKMQEIATKMGFTFRDYVETLEEERKKVLMFQRELPLCLELVTQAIDCGRRQLSGTTAEYLHGGHSECSQQTSSELGPVLEEFIPIKRNGSSDSDNEQPHRSNTENNNTDKKNLGQSDWLRSAQLWNQTSDPSLDQDLPEKMSAVEVKRNGGAFQPFQRERTVKKTDQSPGAGGTSSSTTPVAATSSTAETASAGSGGNSRREEKEGQNQRKQRRCWSPELHRRFLHALQRLGGSHVATPKQIRELMKVDGLTNDEVKSHLQKYRLHTRRPSPTIHDNDSTQAPQFLVVGGIWVPTPEYATMATATSSGEAVGVVTTNGIYAPVGAGPPPPVTQASTDTVQSPNPKVSGQSHSGGEGGGAAATRCNSPATSSSTHTSTVSPAP